MIFDPSDLRGRHVYRLMTSAIVPRPIAWVGSRSSDGVDNLAPFSFFMGVSSRPPALAISVARAGRDRLKDTATNILQTREFTVSIVPRRLAETMNQTSARWAPEQSEFTETGLESIDGTRVAAPRPKGVPFTAECRLAHVIDMGTTHLIVGEIVMFHIDEAVLRRGAEGEPLVDEAALDPLCRLGGKSYSGLGDIFELPTPTLPDRG